MGHLSGLQRAEPERSQKRNKGKGRAAGHELPDLMGGGGACLPLKSLRGPVSAGGPCLSPPQAGRPVCPSTELGAQAHRAPSPAGCRGPHASTWGWNT